VTRWRASPAGIGSPAEGEAVDAEASEQVVGVQFGKQPIGERALRRQNKSSHSRDGEEEQGLRPTARPDAVR
jgi:hypothetical protein